MEKGMKDGRIAFCGVDCSRCPDFREARCPDCRHTEWKEEDACLPVKCCRERKISFCGACADFPCAEMRDFYRESESHERAYALMRTLREGKA